MRPIAEIQSELGALHHETSGMSLSDTAYRRKSLQLELAQSRLAIASDALTTISNGEGRYSRDPLEHASNTIDDMKKIAVDALDEMKTSKE